MAVMTLRPNAAGSETALAPLVAPNWDQVNDVITDEYTTGVNTANPAYQRDLYNLPASGGAGVINFITIYFRCATYGAGANPRYARPALKSNATVTDGTQVGPLGGFVTYSQQWNTNPAPPGTDAWTWADIDALEIGVSIKGAFPNSLGFCTQVYVEIDYVTGWTGKISGVTDPASIMGVAAADIASVKGVA